MKTITLAVFLLLSATLTGLFAFKPSDHSVRVVNQYSILADSIAHNNDLIKRNNVVIKQIITNDKPTK